MIDDIANRLDVPVIVAVLLIILVLVQLILQIVALVDLARRKRVMWDKKWAWLLIILFVSSGIGAILYFAVGRHPLPEASPESTSDVPESETTDRARRAVDLLYGPDERASRQ